MPSIRTIQTDLSSGALNPKLLGRVDIKHYKNGAYTLNNVEVAAEGGAERRPVLRYIDEVYKQITRVNATTITAPNGGTTANADDDDLTTELATTTNIGTTNPYVIVQYDLGSEQEVLFVDVFGLRLATGTVSSDDEVTVQHSTDAASWSDLGGAFDSVDDADIRRRRTGPVTARYIRLARIGATDLTDTFTLDEMKVYIESAAHSNVIPFKFEFNTEQQYLMVLTDYNLAVFKDEVRQVDLPVPWPSADLLDVDWTQSADTLLMVHEDYEPIKILRGSSDDIWDVSEISFDYIPKFAFNPSETNPATTLTPSSTSGTVTLTTGSSVFSSTDVGGYVTGNGGEARISEYTSGTSVVAKVTIPFVDTSAIASGNWSLEQGYEDAWSSSHGWPNSICFHEGRLGIGGSRDLPHNVWLSRSGDFFDFDPGADLDNESIHIVIDSDQVNAIQYMVSARSLVILTTGGEFIASATGVLTPETITIRRNDRRGTRRIKPVFVDGSTFFVQKAADILREFRYNDVSDQYNAEVVSLLSSHLLNDVVSLSHLPPVGDAIADKIYLVNTDGSWATMKTLRSQQVTNFVSGDTENGLVKACGTDGSNMYFVVERTINGATVRYLEKLDTSGNLDCSVEDTDVSGKTTWTGLDHFEGEDVYCIADGYLMSDTYTVSGGSITIPRTANAVEIGYFVQPTITLLPPEIMAPDGVLLGKRYRITRTDVRLRNTLNLLIDGKRVKFRSFGDNIFDEPLSVFTGIKSIRHLGWNKEHYTTFTQDEPLSFEFLSVMQEISY